MPFLICRTICRRQLSPRFFVWNAWPGERMLADLMVTYEPEPERRIACRSCGASIFWGVEVDGRRVSLNCDAAEDGTVVVEYTPDRIEELVQVRVLDPPQVHEDRRRRDRLRYRTHDETCAAALPREFGRQELASRGECGCSGADHEPGCALGVAGV